MSEQIATGEDVEGIIETIMRVYGKADSEKIFAGLVAAYGQPDYGPGICLTHEQHVRILLQLLAHAILKLADARAELAMLHG